MTAGQRRFGAADRRLLPEGRLAGPMPWVIAIMMFLTVLAAAAAMGLGSAAGSLGAAIGNRVTIQVMAADPEVRDREAAAATAVARTLPGVAAVRRIEPAEMERLLERWLGTGGIEADLPVPAMIDVTFADGAATRLGAIRRTLAPVAPSARIDDNGQWLAPLAKLIDALRLLAGILVLLMVGATAATVVLAARAALDTHRGTIEVMHLMGATAVQIARLFQRRIALDALFGGLVGFIAGAIVLLFLSRRVGELGSELLGSAGIPPLGWVVLFALPFGGVALAMLVARVAILRALAKLL